MNLLQLRYFLDSAQNENFSKTAEKHLVPTSTVSAAVKRLEKELSAKLFDRDSNKITLNTNGRILADAVGNAFSEIENAVAQINAAEGQPPEIKLLVRAKRTWITELIIEYKAQHPNVNFRMAHDFDTTDYDSFDIVIDELSSAYENQKYFILRSEPLCIKASANSPLVGKKLTVKQLGAYPFAMMGRSSAMRRLLERLGKQHGFIPNVAMEFDDRECLLRCVELGIGLAIGSVSALSEAGERSIKKLDVSDFNETQTVCVYHSYSAAKSTHLSDFLNFLSQKAK